MAVLNNAEYTLSNGSATTGPFQLKGGSYAVDVIGSSFGTVTLQKLAGDNSTYVTCLTAFSAAGYATVNLPRGDYRIAISATTGVYCRITPIAVIEN